MSATEEIQTAIATLTKMKAESTPGPWARNATELDQVGFWMSPSTCAGCGGDWPLDAPDAELVVTLHCTIDAQLALLGDSIGYAIYDGEAHEYVRDDIGEYGLVLARAINGALK